MEKGTPNPTKESPEGWTERKRILVILAHPDDPEFFCGATIARWTAMGHDVHYCLLTRGDKGTQDRTMLPETLMKVREQEEREAAAILGVRSVRFLDYPDGYLIPDLDIRRDVTRVIRQIQPDILVTSDPTNYYPNGTRINHPDHRAAGEISLSAVFPAAGNPMFFPELLGDEELEPCSVKEVWITLTHQPNVTLDVTDTWGKKIQALYAHKSQIGDPEKLKERMLGRHTADSTPEAPRFEDSFHRLILG